MFRTLLVATILTSMNAAALAEHKELVRVMLPDLICKKQAGDGTLGGSDETFLLVSVARIDGTGNGKRLPGTGNDGGIRHWAMSDDNEAPSAVHNINLWSGEIADDDDVVITVFVFDEDTGDAKWIVDAINLVDKKSKELAEMLKEAAKAAAANGAAGGPAAGNVKDIVKKCIFDRAAAGAAGGKAAPGNLPSSGSTIIDKLIGDDDIIGVFSCHIQSRRGHVNVKWLDHYHSKVTEHKSRDEDAGRIDCFGNESEYHVWVMPAIGVPAIGSYSFRDKDTFIRAEGIQIKLQDETGRVVDAKIAADTIELEQEGHPKGRIFVDRIEWEGGNVWVRKIVR